MGPTLAIPKALERAGLTIDDIDLFEINEAFCSVPVAAIRTLGIDPTIVNVNGSGCSLGHPIAATGARMVVTMVNELRRRGKTLGVVSMCAGGGMGSALVLEVALSERRHRSRRQARPRGRRLRRHRPQHRARRRRGRRRHHGGRAQRREAGRGRRPPPGTGTGISADVTEPGRCRELVDEAVDAMGGLDALVFSTAVSPLAPLEEIDAETWQNVIATNAIAPGAGRPGRASTTSATTA